MADYSKIDLALNDSSFLGRIRACCLVTSWAVNNEATNVANHNARAEWATAVINDGNYAQDTAKQMARVGAVVDTNLQTLGTAMTDANLDSMIATILGNATLLTIVSKRP